jgi:hypothetical protein
MESWREGRAAWDRLAARGRSGEAALEALSDIGSLRRLLDRAELEAVREARGARRSWAEIATRLGVTRQSAWERWRDLDEEPATAPPAESATARAAEELALGVAGSLAVVPDVVGLTWQQARTRLVEQRLHPLAADPGLRRRLRPDTTGYVVTEQKPAAGERVPAHETVTLWLTEGGGDAGDRAPLTPAPPPRARRGAIDEETGESVR